MLFLIAHSIARSGTCQQRSHHDIMQIGAFDDVTVRVSKISSLPHLPK